jgi:predicted ferric reductase
VRKRMYTLFIPIHATCVIVILIAVRHFSIFLFSSTLISSQSYLHRSACVPYVLAAVGLYAFDHLVRIVRTRHTTGWLTAEHALNGGTTLVHVPSLRAGWRAGQHVRVRVVSGGWFAWLATWFLGRARPFTIATGPHSGGMMLQIKAVRSGTRNLLRMAGDAGDINLKEMSTSVEHGRGSARGVRVIVEGPYGKY